MLLNARSNTFLLLMPIDFFSPEIQDKYKKQYLNSLMLPYDSVSDYMSSTIQTFDFPGWDMDLPQQTRMLGKKQEFKSSKPVEDLFTREFKVTFQMADGFLNYFLFLDNAVTYLNLANEKQYFPTFKLGLINNEGFLTCHFDFKKVILKGMSGFDLSHAKAAQEFKTFTANFQFMDWNFYLDFGTEDKELIKW